MPSRPIPSAHNETVEAFWSPCPFAPLADLWQQHGPTSRRFFSKWPVWDPAYTWSRSVSVPVRNQRQTRAGHRVRAGDG